MRPFSVFHVCPQRCRISLAAVFLPSRTVVLIDYSHVLNQILKIFAEVLEVHHSYHTAGELCPIMERGAATGIRSQHTLF